MRSREIRLGETEFNADRLGEAGSVASWRVATSVDFGGEVGAGCVENVSRSDKVQLFKKISSRIAVKGKFNAGFIVVVNVELLLTRY
jgi:hypothetical protein